MEKLIEEIPKQLLADLYNLWEPIVGSEYEWEPIERRVAKSITRIGQAYADGGLELPGEVGRDRVTSILYGGMQTAQGLDLQAKEGDVLIALRPLSGTGKEEK